MILQKKYGIFSLSLVWMVGALSQSMAMDDGSDEEESSSYSNYSSSSSHYSSSHLDSEESSAYDSFFDVFLRTHDGGLSFEVRYGVVCQMHLETAERARLMASLAQEDIVDGVIQNECMDGEQETPYLTRDETSLMGLLLNPLDGRLMAASHLPQDHDERTRLALLWIQNAQNPKNALFAAMVLPSGHPDRIPLLEEMMSDPSVDTDCAIEAAAQLPLEHPNRTAFLEGKLEEPSLSTLQRIMVAGHLPLGHARGIPTIKAIMGSETENIRERLLAAGILPMDDEDRRVFMEGCYQNQTLSVDAKLQATSCLPQTHEGRNAFLMQCFRDGKIDGQSLKDEHIVYIINQLPSELQQELAALDSDSVSVSDSDSDSDREAMAIIVERFTPKTPGNSRPEEK